MFRELTITTPTDREIHMRRSFAAPRQLVWDCHTKPELLRRWLLGPPGWKMPVCEIDLRVGGRYRYEWEHEVRGSRMGMGGTFTEVAAPERLAARERLDDDWTGGETDVTQVFTEENGETTLTLTVRYASQEARDKAASGGMIDGMTQGYRRLDGVLSELL